MPSALFDTTSTIAAISSAVGPAARMIVRVSGGGAACVCEAVCAGIRVEPGVARRVVLRFAGLSVPAWTYTFAGPRSYTGEDLVEFHVPGNPLLARLLLEALLAAGARAAGAGEFTARAYFNGRLDLAAAEGVAATIAAGNEAELRAARQLVAGELARRLRPAMDALAEAVALVEVGIDFADEDVTYLPPDALRARVDGIEALLDELTAGGARFERLTHERRVVLVGRPNAGKSTLLNALAGHARAVVSPIAGTTRDAVSADVALCRGIVRVVDVAGLDDDDAYNSGVDAGAAATASPGDGGVAAIERDMRRHALRELETADGVVLVRDATDLRPPLDLPRAADLVVITKVDVISGGGDASGFPAASVGIDGGADDPRAVGPSGGETGTPVDGPAAPRASACPDSVARRPRSTPQLAAERPARAWPEAIGTPALDCGCGAAPPRAGACPEFTSGAAAAAGVASVSALTGAGLAALRDRFDALAFGNDGGGGDGDRNHRADDGDGGSSLALNARHTRAIDDARAALARARVAAAGGQELVAVDLRDALDSLGQILGAVSPDDVLGRIFSSFCIGK